MQVCVSILASVLTALGQRGLRDSGNRCGEVADIGPPLLPALWLGDRRGLRQGWCQSERG